MIRFELVLGNMLEEKTMIVARVAIADINKYSESATKNAIAKKAYELLCEKWAGRSDYMKSLERDKKEYLKKFSKSTYVVADNSTEGYKVIEIEPKAKRKSNDVVINYLTRNGVKSAPMKKYNSKVDFFKDLKNLYVRKEEGYFILTHAESGMMLAECKRLKDIEERLEYYLKNYGVEELLDTMQKHINHTIKKYGDINNLVEEVKEEIQEEVKKEVEEMNNQNAKNKILEHIKLTSSGTMATLMKKSEVTYSEVDKIKDEWYDFAKTDELRECWQDSWLAFVDARKNKATEEKIMITGLTETSFENDTSWLCYSYKNYYGYEIVKNNGMSEEDYQMLCNSNATFYRTMTKKPLLTDCSPYLQEIILECSQSENEMWFVEWEDLDALDLDTMEEKKNFLATLQEEIRELGIGDDIEIDTDDTAIIVYGGVLEEFLFA